MSRTTVTTDRGVFAALVAGRDDATAPVALLVPGWTGSKEDLAELMPRLAGTRRRVVAVDQRGQYQTAAADNESGYSLDALAADVLAIAAALSDQPVDLLGHSFGGLVAGRAAIADPFAVNSLVLLCSGTGALPDDRQGLVRDVVGSLASRGSQATWTAMRRHERDQGRPMPPDDIERWLRRRFLSSDPTGLAWMARHLIAAPDHRRGLRDVPVPVLVLTGSLDDGWPVAEQRQIADDTGAEHVVLDGLGHSPAVEDAARTAEAVAVFWSRWAPDTSGVTVALDGRPDDVPRARHLVRDALRDQLTADRLADAQLLTSELVTNAVIHAQPPLALRWGVRGGHLVIVVSDSGVGQALARDNHGRGLSVVTALAHRCGAWTTTTGTHAWCWLAVGQVHGARACSVPLSGSTASHGLAAGPMSLPSGHASR